MRGEEGQDDEDSNTAIRGSKTPVITIPRGKTAAHMSLCGAQKMIRSCIQVCIGNVLLLGKGTKQGLTLQTSGVVIKACNTLTPCSRSNTQGYKSPGIVGSVHLPKHQRTVTLSSYSHHHRDNQHTIICV